MSRKSLLPLGILIVAVLAASIFWQRIKSSSDAEGNGSSVSTVPGSKESSAPSVIRLRIPSFALSLHPLKMADVESRQVDTLLHAGLVFQEDSGEVKPVLAESWARSGNQWRFRLKTGITFSDGTPVTPSDVVISICNAMQPSSSWAWALASIRREPAADGKSVRCSGIEAREERDVMITEDRPSTTLLDALSGPAGWILPSHTKEQPYGVVPGIGPYKVKEIVADNRIVLVAHPGGAIQPRLGVVQFNYVPDDAIAASQFLTGRLDVLDLSSPQLVELVVDPATHAPRGGGSIQERKWDRVRIVIVEEKRLAQKGLTEAQIRQFINAFASAIDRKRIASISKGTAIPLTSPFPPVSDIVVPATAPDGLPEIKVSILTEPDAYSDLIAALLPKSVGPIRTDYKGVDKAVLIDSLFKGEFDLISILIEATVHSPDFWCSFFTPGNPFAAFGKPIEGMQAIDTQLPSGVRKAGKMIADHGNWIGILQEHRLQAVRLGISGILFSASGQTNYAYVSRQ